MTPLSSHLFARPSFLGGMASVLDIGGTLVEYNAALTPEQADAMALASDWAAVGGDLRTAMRDHLLELLREWEGEDGRVASNGR